MSQFESLRERGSAPPQACKLYKETIYVFTCPKCGKYHESLAQEHDGYRCIRCNFLLAKTEHDIAADKWRPVITDALKCECGEMVSCTPANMSLASPFKEILCPRIDKHESNLLSLGICYRNSWYPPESFLRQKRTLSQVERTLKPCSSLRDRITLHVLNSLARREERTFRGMDKCTSAMILWIYGVPVGFVTYTKSQRKNLAPTLRQIYVKPENRRKGYAMFMTKTMLHIFPPPQIVGVESPNEASLELLAKLGELRRTEEGYEATGRLRFVSSL